MRYYLDTNILIYILLKEDDKISRLVSDIIKDYESTLMTSSVCIHEFIHLYQIGKIAKINKRDKQENATAILDCIESMDIKIIPTNNLHTREYARLPLLSEHRDPFDRLIIAQAISDKIPIISSDRKFSMYEPIGLNFIFNDKTKI